MGWRFDGVGVNEWAGNEWAGDGWVWLNGVWLNGVWLNEEHCMII